MKKQFNDPRGGLLIALGVLLAALWGIIAFGAYEESKRVKYDVSVRPGAVTYGTLSTATVPAMSVSTYRSSVPMISGGAVRSYAHYGHVTMPKASGTSSYRLHTTSSATVHSIGGGGSTGGGGYNSGGNSSSSSRINYSGGSVSMPSLAMATSSRSSSSISGLTSAVASDASSLVQPTTTVETTTFASPMRKGGIRKAHSDGSGGYEGDYDGEYYNGQWWSEDAEGWVSEPFSGCRRYNDELGRWEVFNGSEWVNAEDQADPTNTPLGDAPWLWIILLSLGYGIVQTKKIYKHKQV